MVNHYRSVAKREAIQKLHDLRDEAGLAPHGSSLVVLRGNPSLRILEQEQQWACDLTVVNNQGGEFARG